MGVRGNPLPLAICELNIHSLSNVKRCVIDLRTCFQRLFDRRQQNMPEVPVIDAGLLIDMESELDRAFGQ